MGKYSTAPLMMSYLTVPPVPGAHDLPEAQSKLLSEDGPVGSLGHIDFGEGKRLGSVYHHCLFHQSEALNSLDKGFRPVV